jgi:phytoene synthase
LQALGDRLQCDVAAGRSDDPVLRAVVHTIRAFDIDADCFRRFLHSMAMDFEVCSYRTWDDLLGYMDGSAAVIGEMMLPILEPLRDDAREPARALGLAFQLTNFLRDVGEDLQRGRVYLPTDDLERFGADPWRRVVDDAWRELMAFEIERCRAIYVAADAGLEALPPASARCVATARTLYSGILDEIERADYDVFTQRVRVPGRRKAWVAARAAVASRRGR